MRSEKVSWAHSLFVWTRSRTAKESRRQWLLIQLQKNNKIEFAQVQKTVVQKNRKQLLGAQKTPTLGVSVKKRKFGSKLGQPNSGAYCCCWRDVVAGAG